MGGTGCLSASRAEGVMEIDRLNKVRPRLWVKQGPTPIAGERPFLETARFVETHPSFPMPHVLAHGREAN